MSTWDMEGVAGVVGSEKLNVCDDPRENKLPVDVLRPWLDRLDIRRLLPDEYTCVQHTMHFQF